jgi:hypothetical protein
MSPVTDKPVTIPDRNLQEEKRPGGSEPPRRASHELIRVFQAEVREDIPEANLDPS